MVSGEILVVGASPVGLTAALELARRGIAARVIDQAESPSSLSKAIGVNARSLELLEASGASAALLEAGTKVRQVTLHDRGAPLFTLGFSCVDHRYNFMLALPQSHSEAILADRLQSHGIQVERGCRLTRLLLEGGKVRCLLETPSQAQEITPRLVIGADGARSLVRRSLRVGFPGRAYAKDWILMDARLDWPHGEDEVNIFLADPGFLFVITMGPGRFRLVSDQPDPAALLPAGARVRKVLWRSSFRVAHHLVSDYGRGPVFLAGDAAHLHSPVGARGMNLGIEDAAVLAKLIAEDATGRYHDLRHPVGRRTVGRVKRQTQGLVSGNPIAGLLRRHLAPALLALPPLRRSLCRTMLGLTHAGKLGLEDRR